VRIEVAISAGELVDRITILELKAARLPPALARAVELQLDAMRTACARALPESEWLSAITRELRKVNAELWDVEEALRACERTKSFGARFVELARRVYQANDRRAALKRCVDERAGGEAREYKSHDLPPVQQPWS
jgi:hypothetical protein